MPLVSVLITTFNRKNLLLRAVGSVLSQDFRDFELVIFDDCSTDGTDKVIQNLKKKDKRIRSIRPEKNIGSIHGDREILRQFFYKFSEGKYVIYLCDDDFWIPKNLLSRSIELMEEDPEIVQVAGAQVQIYDHHICDVTKIDSLENWWYEEYKEIAGGLVLRNVFPHGLISKDFFFQLQCENPILRNILTGASLFRKSSLIMGGVLANKKGAKWQAGYELTTGIATQGSTYYFDEPSIAAGVDITSASFRGTQLSHLKDCIKSVRIAFTTPIKKMSQKERKKFLNYRKAMARSIVMNYIRNKAGFKLGWFQLDYLPELEKNFHKQINIISFIKIIVNNNIPLKKENIILLCLVALPSKVVQLAQKYFHRKYGLHWIRFLSQ